MNKNVWSYGATSGGSKTVGGRPAARKGPAPVTKTRAAALKRAGRLMARFAITGGKGM